MGYVTYQDLIDIGILILSLIGVIISAIKLIITLIDKASRKK